jgi:hypothetical protein
MSAAIDMINECHYYCLIASKTNKEQAMGTRESVFHSFAQEHVRRESGLHLTCKAPVPEYIDGRWMLEITSIEALTASTVKHALFDLMPMAAIELARPDEPRAFALSEQINECLKEAAQ